MVGPTFFCRYLDLFTFIAGLSRRNVYNSKTIQRKETEFLRYRNLKWSVAQFLIKPRWQYTHMSKFAQPEQGRNFFT